MRYHVCCGAALIALAILPWGRAGAQSTDGRWMIAGQGSVNLWIADFDRLKAGPGGLLVLRYGISPHVSLGVQAGYEEPKIGSSTLPPEFPSTYLKLKSIPASFIVTCYFLSSGQFRPRIDAGAGVLAYKREIGGGTYYPDDRIYFAPIFPVTIGFDALLSRRVAFMLDAGFRFTGDAVDLRDNASPDGVATIMAGVGVYLGSSDSDDDDGDGLTNGQERRVGSDPNTVDSDGDRLADGEEVRRHNTSPIQRDSDDDGLPDGDEVLRYHTLPSLADTDADGISDSDEVIRYRTNPLKSDTDGDGLNDGEEVLRIQSDPLKVDTDGDGLSDWDEARTFGTSPLLRDTESDGLTDGEEVRTYKTDPLRIDTDAGGINDGAEARRGSNPLVPDDDIENVFTLERGKSVVLEGIVFASGSARLGKSSEVILEKAYVALAANPAISVEIAGHCDDWGSQMRNNELSRQRAETVKQWFVARGIASYRLAAVGYGSRQPLVPNTSPEARAKNRRIEFRVR